MHRNLIIILGGSGFIGRQTIEMILSTTTYNIINIDVKKSDIDNTRFREFVFDINDYESLDKIFETEKDKIRIIFNLIAIADITKCNEFILDAINLNLMVNANILRLIRKNGLTKFDNAIDQNKILNSVLYVYASSIYADSNISGVYGITKKASEDLIKFYHSRHGLNYIIFRYGTIYGCGAKEGNSIYDLIKSIIDNKKISHYGHGNELRYYINVKDAAAYWLDICQTYSCWNKTIELSGINKFTASELICLLSEIFNNELECEFRKEENYDHYKQTPYRFENNVVKYIPKFQTDFSRGLLDVIKEIQNGIE